MLCPEREALQDGAREALQNLIDITKKEIEALAQKNQALMAALDKELERAFGAKERAFGALEQHTKEHNC